MDWRAQFVSSPYPSSSSEIPRARAHQNTYERKWAQENAILRSVGHLTLVWYMHTTHMISSQLQRLASYFNAVRYCVQFENHAIEIALIRVKVMSSNSNVNAGYLTQVHWRCRWVVITMRTKTSEVLYATSVEHEWYYQYFTSLQASNSNVNAWKLTQVHWKCSFCWWFRVKTKKTTISHGTPRSTEIQKKMPWFGTNIFWLGIPQGSQKYPFGNISCVS